MTIKALFSKHKGKFVLYMFGVLITAPSNLLITLSFGNAFKILERPDTVHLIVISLGLALAPGILQYLSRRLRVGFMNDVLLDVRVLSYNKLMSTPIDTFKNNSMESYRSTLTSDINIFETDFFLSILNIGYSIGSFLLGALWLYFIEPSLCLLIVVGSILVYLITLLFEKKAKVNVERVMESNETFHRVMSNIIRGLETIKIFKVEEYFKNQGQLEVHSNEEVKKEKMHFEDIQQTLFIFVSAIIQMTGFSLAAYYLSMGNITMAQLVVALNLVGQLTWSISNLVSFLNRYKASRTIFETLTYIPNSDIKEEKMTYTSELCGKNISFSYGDQKVLNNVSFSVKPGEKLLITGPSGTGKTTLLEIITGNRNLQEGAMAYDGIDRAIVNDQSYWEFVGYARQEHFMFDASIKENILLGNQEDIDCFNNILKELDLFEWIDSLPEKENTQLSQNASNISGGQRQRISIARQLYRESELYIFDEPSASLDDATALHIYETLLNLKQSVILVSHRHLDMLAKRADHLLVLEAEDADNEGI